ncbi:hypothetical protein Tcan_11927 [Toxocara canis]|uniref:BHLH domain-containing protein n=1 Tax=Toxocara canis TaxID=6265 RepID=A0A0B2VCN6_TOXCA|nr:hypothetical protein Tcan_11927 [Toxocara canis]
MVNYTATAYSKQCLNWESTQSSGIGPKLTNVRNLAQHRSMVSFIDAMNCPDPLKQALLRQIIPCYPINKKMSKQEILRGAIHYIRILEYLLGMRPTFA